MVALTSNLKFLKLSVMVSNLETYLRQARENHQDYDEFLLGLTEVEVMTRQENVRKHRIREARFPLN